MLFAGLVVMLLGYALAYSGVQTLRVGAQLAARNADPRIANDLFYRRTDGRWVRLAVGVLDVLRPDYDAVTAEYAIRTFDGVALQGGAGQPTAAAQPSRAGSLSA
jgi:hypothetical protein